MGQDELLIVPTSEIVFGIKTDGTFINNIFKKDDSNIKTISYDYGDTDKPFRL